MNKSLFIKYFLICTSIILVSILFLGAILLGCASQSFKMDKQAVLTQNAKTAAEITLEAYKKVNYEITPKNLMSSYQVLSGAINADIFFTDTSGKTLVCSETVCKHLTYTIGHGILDQIDENAALGESFFEVGKLGGMYSDEPYYTAAYPVQINSVKNLGYIFVSTSAKSLTSFLSDLMKMFCVSAIAVIMVSFVIIYFVTDKMVSPLRQMAKAAKSFGKGDFSQRVPVNGYDEIAELAMSLNTMAAELTAFESTRSSFVANVSHDLRTPMTTIGGFIDGILDGTIPKEKQEYYLRIVSDEVKRLTKLVKVMLNVARIEAGDIHLNKSCFNIFDIVCKILFTFEQTINAKEVSIEGLEQANIMVHADQDLIQQVLYNLIDNAVKFVNEKGSISFEFKTEGSMAHISITNTGKGIEKEDLPRIFDRFYKSDRSRGVDKNGVGLGLYIVKSIITAHGGDIIVNSAAGQYCRFTVSLPVANKSK